jgi:DNA-binding MarR family transcriptional regulator
MPNDMQSSLPLSSFLTYRLNTLAQLANRAGARWHQQVSGLTLAEWRIIATLGFFGHMSPSDLANRTMMDKAVISRVKTSLTGKGLIFDDADSGDSRKRILGLTDEGGQLYQSTMPAAQERQEELLGLFNDEELETLIRSFEKLQSHFERRMSE